MRKSVDLSLILPCYNETEIFLDSVRKITTVLSQSDYRWELIFVDDKSSDGTDKLIKQVYRRNTHFRSIFHTKNLGRGAAVRDGIRAARGTIVGFIDIDLEVSPIYMLEVLPILLSKNADIVIGKRIYTVAPSSLVRGILSLGYKCIANVVLHTGGVDTESGYKFFNRKKIVPVLQKTKNNGWFWDTEIVVRSLQRHLKIVELPVLFLRRSDKTSTVNIIPDVLDYLHNMWKFRLSLKR